MAAQPGKKKPTISDLCNMGEGLLNIVHATDKVKWKTFNKALSAKAEDAPILTAKAKGAPILQAPILTAKAKGATILQAEARPQAACTEQNGSKVDQASFKEFICRDRRDFNMFPVKVHEERVYLKGEARVYEIPLVNLLQVGHPKKHTARSSDFTEENVPELLRMASDPVLLKHSDTPKRWAPIHAVKILGVLKKGGERMVTLLDIPDPWLLKELPSAIAKNGSQVLSPLRNYLQDSSHWMNGRLAAVEALDLLNVESPDTTRELSIYECFLSLLSSTALQRSVAARIADSPVYLKHAITFESQDAQVCYLCYKPSKRGEGLEEEAGSCHHCERFICPDCTSRCVFCTYYFCHLCHTIDYGERDTRAVCIDCRPALLAGASPTLPPRTPIQPPPGAATQAAAEATQATSSLPSTRTTELQPTEQINDAPPPDHNPASTGTASEPLEPPSELQPAVGDEADGWEPEAESGDEDEVSFRSLYPSTNGRGPPPAFDPLEEFFKVLVKRFGGEKAAASPPRAGNSRVGIGMGNVAAESPASTNPEPPRASDQISEAESRDEGKVAPRELDSRRVGRELPRIYDPEKDIMRLFGKDFTTLLKESYGTWQASARMGNSRGVKDNVAPSEPASASALSASSAAPAGEESVTPGEVVNGGIGRALSLGASGANGGKEESGGVGGSARTRGEGPSPEWLREAASMLEQGNALMQEGKEELAMESFEKLVELLTSVLNDISVPPGVEASVARIEMRKSVRNMLACCYTTMAALSYKQGHTADVITHATHALSQDKLPMAYFYRGSALSDLGRLERAHGDLVLASQLAPHDKSISEALAKVVESLVKELEGDTTAKGKAKVGEADTPTTPSKKSTARKAGGAAREGVTGGEEAQGSGRQAGEGGSGVATTPGKKAGKNRATGRKGKSKAEVKRDMEAERREKMLLEAERAREIEEQYNHALELRRLELERLQLEDMKQQIAREDMVQEQRRNESSQPPTASNRNHSRQQPTPDSRAAHRQQSRQPQQTLQPSAPSTRSSTISSTPTLPHFFPPPTSHPPFTPPRVTHPSEIAPPSFAPEERQLFPHFFPKEMPTATPPPVAPEVQLSGSPADKVDDSCCICFDKSRDALALPCGHLSTCQDCLRMVLKSDNPFCPICRQVIRELVVIATR